MAIEELLLNSGRSRGQGLAEYVYLNPEDIEALRLYQEQQRKELSELIETVRPLYQQGCTLWFYKGGTDEFNKMVIIKREIQMSEM